MGVIRCVECGATVNAAASRCPECGADPRTGLTEEERAAAAERLPLDAVDMARQARARGQRFLEVVLPLTDGEARALRSKALHTVATAASAAERAGLLAAVEDVGWRLLAVGYVPAGMKYEREPLAFVDSGPVEPTAVVGVYLFRSTDDAAADGPDDPPASPSPASPAPEGSFTPYLAD